MPCFFNRRVPDWFKCSEVIAKKMMALNEMGCLNGVVFLAEKNRKDTSQIQMVFYNVRSERELMATIPVRLDCLWFLGYDLDDEMPNHSLLSKARTRWGVFEEKLPSF